MATYKREVLNGELARKCCHVLPNLLEALLSVYRARLAGAAEDAPRFTGIFRLRFIECLGSKIHDAYQLNCHIVTLALARIAPK